MNLELIRLVERDRQVEGPPILVGSSDKAKEILGGKPQYADLRQILAHAWQWISNGGA